MRNDREPLQEDEMTPYESLFRLVALKGEVEEFKALEKMRDALFTAYASLREHRCGTGMCHCCKSEKAIRDATGIK
jgi:hypothetical protein